MGAAAVGVFSGVWVEPALRVADLDALSRQVSL